MCCYREIFQDVLERDCCSLNSLRKHCDTVPKNRKSAKIEKTRGYVRRSGLQAGFVSRGGGERGGEGREGTVIRRNE